MTSGVTRTLKTLVEKVERMTPERIPAVTLPRRHH